MCVSSNATLKLSHRTRNRIRIAYILSWSPCKKYSTNILSTSVILKNKQVNELRQKRRYSEVSSSQARFVYDVIFIFKQHLHLRHGRTITVRLSIRSTDQRKNSGRQKIIIRHYYFSKL